MAQAALQQLELAHILRDLMECVADPVTVIGLNGGTVLQNAASRNVLPRPPPQDFAGWENSFVLHSADGTTRLSIEQWPLVRALRGETVVGSETSVLMPKNPAQSTILLASARPIRSVAGEIVGAVLISRDVTEQRRLERELAQSQRMEAIGQLAAGIAHDFNNILTAISSSADSLQDDPSASERQIQIAKRIASASDYGADLVQRLLAFARKQPLAPSRIEVNTLAKDVVRLLRPTLPSNIAITSEFGDGELSVVTDASQLANALLNLAVNARDAMPDGGQLSFRTAPERDTVLIEVSDTGVGIPFDQQARVFEPFYTTKPPGKGTGLGLAMVYGFVAQSGGALDLSSAPGVGTIIRLRLPAA